MDTGFFDTLRSFKITSRSHRIADDDFVDRFNHYHTTLMICVLSIVICAKQYIVGEPLQCWVPAEFSDGWEKYAENYCWIKNTYYVHPKSDDLPGQDERRQLELKYYQWVPFVLGLQAIMFNVPRIFWQMLNWQSGVDIKSLLEKANAPGNIDPTTRDENIKTITRQITSALFYAKESGVGMAVVLKRALFKVLCCGGTKTGTYLVSIYLLVKLFYLANLVAQFFIINAFLGSTYSLFGFELLRNLMSGKNWEDTAHFPRITYCDFKVRSLGTVRPYTLQCVLVINMFNEKVYIFLWFWFAIVLFITLLNTLKWLVWTLFFTQRTRDIHKVIKAKNIKQDAADKFVDDLKADGMFVLKMIALNSGEIFAHDLIRQLFTQHRVDNEAPPTPTRASSHVSSSFPSSRNGLPPNEWSPMLKMRSPSNGPPLQGSDI